MENDKAQNTQAQSTKMLIKNLAKSPELGKV